MGNSQTKKSNANHINLVKKIKEYIRESASPYENNTVKMRNNNEQLEELNIINPSNIGNKIKSKEIVETSVDLLNLLFTKSINKEINLNILNPSVVHKFASLGESQAMGSQLNYFDDLWLNKRLKKNYIKWTIDKNENSSLLEKLGQLSSIRKNSNSEMSFEYENNKEQTETENKSTRKGRKDTRKSSSINKKETKTKLNGRQKSEGVTSKTGGGRTIISHIARKISRNNVKNF
jgi:hypothetical protein